MGNKEHLQHKTNYKLRSYNGHEFTLLLFSLTFSLGNIFTYNMEHKSYLGTTMTRFQQDIFLLIMIVIAFFCLLRLIIALFKNKMKKKSYKYLFHVVLYLILFYVYIFLIKLLRKYSIRNLLSLFGFMLYVGWFFFSVNRMNLFNIENREIEENKSSEE